MGILRRFLSDTMQGVIISLLIKGLCCNTVTALPSLGNFSTSFNTSTGNFSKNFHDYQTGTRQNFTNGFGNFSTNINGTSFGFYSGNFTEGFGNSSESFNGTSFRNYSGNFTGGFGNISRSFNESNGFGNFSMSETNTRLNFTEG